MPKPTPVREITRHLQQTPLKPVAKLISRPEASLPAATPPRSPTPPVPSTPLPNFITLFVTSEWFHKFFPSCNQNVSKIPELTYFLKYGYFKPGFLCPIQLKLLGCVISNGLTKHLLHISCQVFFFCFLISVMNITRHFKD